VNKPIYLGCTLLVSLILASSISGQSFYSSHGIGLTKHTVSNRSAGMGSAGLAVIDNITVNFINPAPLSSLPFTYISGSFLHHSTSLQSNGVDASISNTNVDAVQFVVPLMTGRAVVAAGLSPYSSVEYAFDAEGVDVTEPYIESLSGSGAVNGADLSISFRPVNRLYLGVTGTYYFGVLRSGWRAVFTSGESQNVRTETQDHVSGFGVRFGGLFRVLPRWRVGFVFSPATAIDVDRTLSLIGVGSFADFEDINYDLPAALGVGTSVRVATKWLLAADYYTEKWQDASFVEDGYVNSSRRVAFGLEYLPRTFTVEQYFSSSYFSRVAYRAGFYHRDLGLELPAGEKVAEWFVTFGLGMPLKWAASRMDLAFELGKRGSADKNPVEETVSRLSISLTVGEKWFTRRRQ
jgi:long-subunit fatty acid transport protein